MVGEQTPTKVGTSQASHWPLQAALQHTPSTQMPLSHEFGSVHAAPMGPVAKHLLLLQ